MKLFKYASMLLIMVTMCIGMVGCSKESEPEVSTDYAATVAGVYTGKLSVNGSVIEDAYVVRVDRISSTVVRVSAEFYSSGYENYNVSYVNGQYLFESESSFNITIAVTGKAMNINFLNGAGNITTFIGSKD